LFFNILDFSVSNDFSIERAAFHIEDVLQFGISDVWDGVVHDHQMDSLESVNFHGENSIDLS
jgi:hypothetical protein